MRSSETAASQLIPKGKTVASFFLNRWVDSIKASAREEIQETARSVLLYVVAVVMGLMALVFATLAGFWWLEIHYGAIVAALIVAGLFAVCALALLMWASWSGTSSAAPADAESATEETASATQANAFADLPDKMGIDLDSVAGTLSDAGYRTEALIVTASKSLLKQLTPLQFISLVFVGSFFFGRRLRRV